MTNKPPLPDDVAAAALLCLPDPLLLMDTKGHVEYLNPAALDLLGYTASELIGASVKEFIVAQPGQRIDPVEWLARWAADPASPQLRYLTLTGRTRAGALLHLSVRVGRIDRRPARFVVTLRDVTDEQQQHAEAKHAYLLASRILAVSEDAIVNIDAERRIVFFNRKAEQLFGYPAAEVLTQPVDMLLPERYRTAHHTQIDSFQHSKSPARMMGERGEIIGLTKSGEEVPLEASISKVFIEGKPTFSAQLRDIRARIAAERSLRESEQRFRTVFDRAMEAIALLDPDGVVLEINDATQQLLGVDVKPVGQRFWELPWWAQTTEPAEIDEGRQTLEQNIQRCRAGEEHRNRVDMQDAEGRARVLDFSLRPVVTDGKTTAIIAEGRDITALVDQNG